jgi:pSer/pThr/pTyr-binding forkhead associated (FHA) protein
MLKLQFRDEPGNFVKLSVATVTLGRDEGNDVVIDSPSVSDFHAEITADAQHPLIVDLLSANGTFVNERRITGRCQLRAWDVIRLGAVELEVTDPNTHRPEDWALRTESDLLASQFHVLRPVTVVGRDPACDLSIDSNLLSRRHAELIIEEGHLKVVDLGSVNGTFLNGEKIEEGEARPGDELRFDKHSFIVTGPGPADVSHSDLSGDKTMVREMAGEAPLVAAEDAAVTAQDTRVSGEATAVPGEAAAITGGAGEADAVPLLEYAESIDQTVLVSGDETLLFVAPPPQALLSQVTFDEQPLSIALEGEPLRLGRAPDSDIVLADKSVSKQHAEFAFENEGWLVRDLGSSNGVLVNGEPVAERQLGVGDRVQLGRLEFEFTLAGQSVQEAEPATMIFQSGAPPVERGRRGGAPGKGDDSRVYRWLLAAIALIAGVGMLWFSSR